MEVQEYPAISIICPTHRTYPENRQDPTRVQNLIKDAEQRLQQEFSAREVAPLVEALRSLAAEVDHQHAEDGLALFVSSTHQSKHYIPFAVREAVTIDQSFATRELVHAFNRSPRYRVLVLSEKPTRLYEGVHDSLEEIVNSRFPVTHEKEGGRGPLPGGAWVNTSAARDERHRQFFRDVDRRFGEWQRRERLPLVVVGVERYQSFFREVTSHADAIIATVTGSHDKTPAHELGKRIWPEVLAALQEAKHARKEELERAVGAGKSASGIQQVWRAAQEGRGQTLFVEEGYHVPAEISADGSTLRVIEDPQAPGAADDAVDEVIEAVIMKGGEVVFLEDGTLDEHQRIALTLRY